MNKIILYFASLFIVFNSQAQVPQKDSTLTFKISKPDSTTKVYSEVEKMPSFPGGEEALSGFLVKRVKYPEKAIEERASGTVYTSFIVDTIGRLTNIVIIGSSGNESLDKEALRVINSMPSWAPGQQSGVMVPVQMVIPIYFTLK